eukprot:COSAG06_NODE_56_length_27627_cov_106.527136_20_plen_57_part_00
MLAVSSLLADLPRARQQDHDLQLQLGANRYGAAGRRALVRSLPLLVSDTLVLIGII